MSDQRSMLLERHIGARSSDVRLAPQMSRRMSGPVARSCPVSASDNLPTELGTYTQFVKLLGARCPRPTPNPAVET